MVCLNSCKAMGPEPLSRIDREISEKEADVSPLLKGLLIALLPSGLAWLALIYSAVKLGQAIHR